MAIEELAHPRNQHSNADCGGSQQSLRRIVVLGIGNILLRDDGVGVRVVEHLRGEPRSPAPEFIDGGTLSFSLLELIATADAMLVADAAELGEIPGTVRLFEDESMDRFLSGARHRSVHEVSLSDVLDMARLSDCLPKRRALLSIQPMTIDWGEALSPELAASFEAACTQAREVLGRWGSAL